MTRSDSASRWTRSESSPPVPPGAHPCLTPAERSLTENLLLAREAVVAGFRPGIVRVAQALAQGAYETRLERERFRA